MSLPTGYPYFRWWVKDAESDEFYLTASDAELGFYHRCLNRSWNSGGLPIDPAARAKLLGKSRAYADKMWTKIGAKFSPSKDDPTRLVNGKQEEERIYVHSMSTRNASAGRLKNKCKANGDQHTYGSGSVSGSVEVSENLNPEGFLAEFPPKKLAGILWEIHPSPSKIGFVETCLFNEMNKSSKTANQFAESIIASLKLWAEYWRESGRMATGLDNWILSGDYVVNPPPLPQGKIKKSSGLTAEEIAAL